MYTLVLEFETALNDRKNNIDNNADIYIKPLRILNDFKKNYYENAIFIPKQLDIQIKEILGFCFKQHYSDLQKQAEQAARKGDEVKANQLSEEALNRDFQLYTLRDNFRDEIRSILGLVT
ncbi:hypothetical protein [Acinetobacter terrestris]|uniref:Uncharacterized protein n=1 Tax=Acinetobacter terrestris TaxID=2529843 RepID=A0AAW6UTS1_9GAMM|nr:hypothetical protein [Acinetobacter terrestris]MDK1684668.1 hypothetical protein [Acinetobacter terrestris]